MDTRETPAEKGKEQDLTEKQKWSYVNLITFFVAAPCVVEQPVHLCRPTGVAYSRNPTYLRLKQDGGRCCLLYLETDAKEDFCIILIRFLLPFLPEDTL